MLKPHVKFLIVIFCLFVLGGCVGARTFHDLARAGDTVAVAAGRVTGFSRSSITVTITPSSGSPIVYGPNNPAVRAVINLYPDPLSSLLVSMETQQDLTPSAQTYGSVLLVTIPNREKDWWQTTVFVDLPTSLPVGTASIEISDDAGEYVYSDVQIVEGTGAPNTFDTNINGPLNPNQLASLERIAYYSVDFNGSTIPFAIQVDLSHSPDVDHGGTGRAYVVNPRGDLKNVTWSDTGTSLRVIILPAKGQALDNVHNYKFYVAGGVTNLAVLSVKAVDINGNNVSGVTATLN